MIRLEQSIRLKAVKQSDCRFLFGLLLERDPKISISHLATPTYKQHVDFVLSKPYSKWYVVYDKKKKVGSIYLSKQDEIGIFLKKRVANIKIKQCAMEQLMKMNPRNRFIANCNPKNQAGIKFFKKNGFKLIQYSYECFPKWYDF